MDHSRAIFPRPACGERVGVRGVLATAHHPQVSRKLPLTREPRRERLPTSPRERGEVIGAWSFLSPARKQRRSHTLISATRYQSARILAGSVGLAWGSRNSEPKAARQSPPDNPSAPIPTRSNSK